jgi:formylglycine-generating enzyme required for sulfatase activity
MTTNPIDYSLKASVGLTKRIPSGYIRVGSRFHPREHPPRTVYVAEFDMAHAAVTVNQYKVFLDSKANRMERWWSKEGWAWANGKADGWGREDRWLPDGWEIQVQRPYRPVAGVTAFEAEAYCAWLSAQRKKIVRLPSEEEWEHAARGEDGRPFPWGELFDASLTNTMESERFDTVDAASIAGDCSPFGVMDMAGNVQEWTSSPYTPAPGEQTPPGPQRIARGGSFNDTVFGARSSYRRAYPPGYFFPFLGFRVVEEDR